MTRAIFHSEDSDDHFPRVVLVRNETFMICIFDYTDNMIVVSRADKLAPCTRCGCRCKSPVLSGNALEILHTIVPNPPMDEPKRANEEMHAMKRNPEAYLAEAVL